MSVKFAARDKLETGNTTQGTLQQQPASPMRVKARCPFVLKLHSASVDGGPIKESTEHLPNTKCQVLDGVLLRGPSHQNIAVDVKYSSSYWFALPHRIDEPIFHFANCHIRLSMCRAGLGFCVAPWAVGAPKEGKSTTAPCPPALFSLVALGGSVKMRAVHTDTGLQDLLPSGDFRWRIVDKLQRNGHHNGLSFRGNQRSLRWKSRAGEESVPGPFTVHRSRVLSPTKSTALANESLWKGASKRPYEASYRPALYPARAILDLHIWGGIPILGRTR
ncbi:uncharacterized protein CLUP02_09412 [Colletotrichum lupini]|uniref:Uncharacterized protein n=1 Tax=Colletotrichum lupini TaxID=145971 RepID=A0A9Q8WHX9_9PEZI|nr:uncharacterized protein CLUP02_09412 [Colletotrichum lupini]UQC83916.1 hypothetical protein CLUP02_09412 [Colletotrichum lupini]